MNDQKDKQWIFICTCKKKKEKNIFMEKEDS